MGRILYIIAVRLASGSDKWSGGLLVHDMKAAMAVIYVIIHSAQTI